jgi:APA family basic amino acid/polyamine antiporter
MGSVIGSGIFLTTGLMAQAIPSAGLVLAAWAAGGVLALAGGLTYAEMGTMFPRSGGLYVFLDRAYGPLVSFLYGWTALLVVFAGGMAAVAVGFAEYVSYFAPALSLDRVVFRTSLGSWTPTISAGQLVAVAAMVALAAVNYTGVRAGNSVNVVLTVAKIAGLAALPLMALASPRVTLDLDFAAIHTLARPLAAFGVAMIAVFWACEGWYFVMFAAGEIKDPARTLPRALILGIVSLVAIYLAVNVAYFYALPMDQIRGTTRIGERAATALVGSWGATFVSLTVVVSTLGANAAAILAGSRLLFAMAEDGLFFQVASRVHPRFRTPHIAIVLLSAWGALLALSGTYEQLFTYVAFGSILFSIAGGLAVFRLRRRLPDHPRPYRAWGYPVVPALFVLGCTAFVINTLVERPWESLAGVGLIVLGLPAYWYWRRTAVTERQG